MPAVRLRLLRNRLRGHLAGNALVPTVRAYLREITDQYSGFELTLSLNRTCDNRLISVNEKTAMRHVDECARGFSIRLLGGNEDPPDTLQFWFFYGLVFANQMRLQGSGPIGGGVLPHGWGRCLGGWGSRKLLICNEA